jgi:glutamate-1-semialdehyde 2,1-aminomutase
MSKEKSEELYKKAQRLMPGGVSSPVRAIDPYPFYVQKASDSRIWDVDGNLYIDFCMGYGPLMLGHAHPAVRAAVDEQLKRGWDYGAPVELEIDLAERIQEDFPSMEMLRFVSTGTEATMSALRAARGYTGKETIVKVEGGYHGAHDAVLLRPGSFARPSASSLGVPAGAIKNTVQVPFNDVAALSGALEKHDAACFIVEPVLGNIGPVLPEENYLADVKKVTEENDTLLIFDEVITGFRLCIGGAQCLYGITPDLTTLGKIAGGGFPIGVFGGRREIMECVAPSGGVYNAGTFSGHPVTLAAGLATLRILKEEGYRRANGLGDLLRRMLTDLLEELDLRLMVQGIGTMFQVFFTQRPVKNYRDAQTSNVEDYKHLAAFMRAEGIFLTPSQYETNFISLAHSNEDLEYAIRAYANAFRRLYSLDIDTPGY